MQENVAKHGVRSRDGRETGSDGDTSCMERNDILIITGSRREEGKNSKRKYTENLLYAAGI